LSRRKRSNVNRPRQAGAELFVQTVRQLSGGWGDDRIRRELKEWLATDHPNDPFGNVARSLDRYLMGDDTQPRAILRLSEFCNAKFETSFGDSHFGSDRRADDWAAKFAREARGADVRLRQWQGEYVVVRAGTTELLREKRIEPNWSQSNYRLALHEVGTGGRFEFRHYNVADESGWSGPALSCGRYLYLVGYDLKESDVASLTLTEHESPAVGRRVLVGVQLCTLGVEQYGLAAVARRIAAVRSDSGNFAQMLKVAQDWIISPSPKLAQQGAAKNETPSVERDLSGMGIVVPWSGYAGKSSKGD
jgi:hypothetical protein